jgi:UDP-N-acetylmuramoyl-L-alanyl-D-glutamate--2,6-diaminopimelate ligase
MQQKNLMKLSQILAQVKGQYRLPANFNADQIEVEDIAIDSRLVKKNSVFFALGGKEKDGAEFISSALEKGACAVIAKGFIESENNHALLVEFLKIFYRDLPKNIYAITGTNGKTSTAEFTRQILALLEIKSASIGTLGVICDNEIQAQIQQTSLTTPDIASLYKNLNKLKEHGVDDVAIEVSSIGLDQGRAAGLNFCSGGFTNFTQDHLDYHKTMAEYFRCKSLIFDQSKCAVINSDIAQFGDLKKICDQKNLVQIDYGRSAKSLKLIDQNHFEYRQKKYYFELSVAGEFQIYNMLCALGSVLSAHKISDEKLENLVTKFNQLHPAAGRMQLVGTKKNGAKIYVDFAHTPDALTNVLKLARQLTKKRVVVLFGCGGNRDAKKRPIMGKIASDLADQIIVTDDNPRHENPASIRQEILQSCDVAKTIEIDNRLEAIKHAIELLWQEDVLILAGKGHEKYQIIGEVKSTFDEEKIVKQILGC